MVQVNWFFSMYLVSFVKGEHGGQRLVCLTNGRVVCDQTHWREVMFSGETGFFADV